MLQEEHADQRSGTPTKQGIDNWASKRISKSHKLRLVKYSYLSQAGSREYKLELIYSKDPYYLRFHSSRAGLGDDAWPLKRYRTEGSSARAATVLLVRGRY